MTERFGLDIGLITNGVRPLTEFADAFKWIRVSIDASTPDEYMIEKGVQRYAQGDCKPPGLGQPPAA